MHVLPSGSKINWGKPKINMKKFNKKLQQANKPPSIKQDEDTKPPRLNKYVANAGICSRRKADELIKKGLVQVNNVVVREMGYRVQPGEVVKYNGKVIEPENSKVYILMNKPKNTITTLDDERGRTTVMKIVENACDERIFPVGRLDRNTTGLLLMTNDGDLAQKLTHPKYGVKKIYHVKLDKPLLKKHLTEIATGLTLEDGPVMVDKVDYLQDREKDEIGIEIHIGKNRIVRRIFEHFGYEVKKLDRVYYGGLTKKNITRGFYRFLTEQEVIMLKHFS